MKPSVPRAGMARKYPPLVAIIATLVLAIFALPSALNLPQANPGQTLEYAPVSGNAGQTAGGNFAGLGLGSTAAGAGLASLVGQQPGVPSGQGGAPSTKRCVGNPPRQTEDPLSPPCVAFFQGDNGGATYPGVTGTEIRLLIYAAGGFSEPASDGVEVDPTNTEYDLWRPAAGTEDVAIRMFRVLQAELNDRYQTYGRRVHFFVHYDAGGTANYTPAERRADATDEYARLHPFAVLLYVYSYALDYSYAMAAKGVMVFVGSMGGYGAPAGESAAFFHDYPGLIWSFNPTMDQRGEAFAALACAQIVGRPSIFSGNPGDNGKARRFGLLVNGDPSRPELDMYARLVRSGMESCGAEIVDERTYEGARNDTDYGASKAAQDMAAFKQEQISTVIQVGADVVDSHAAGGLAYYPEWILAGDGVADLTLYGTRNDATVYSHAWTMTTYVRRGPYGADPCFQLAKEAQPSAPDYDVQLWYCGLYDSVNQFFTGVQVAGPRLTPQNMDSGFHAIPAIASSSARIPACFYGAGDYACVKDAMTEWWDNGGRDPGGRGENGCWRVVENGMRHLDQHWSKQEISASASGSDACNAQATV